MRTPSLRRRVTLSAFAVFVVLLVLLEGLVYFALQARLEDGLRDVLATRVELAQELAELSEGEELADRLAARSVPAAVTTPDGEVLTTTAIPRFDRTPPSPTELRTRRISATFGTADGGAVEVFVSRGGVDATTRRFALINLAGATVASVVALVLFRRAAALAIAPLDHVVVAARRTAAGREGERLEPDDPSTELGRFATAYDQMLDSLEEALRDARDAEERTRRFLDDAAHQMRGPLTTIRASIETLLRVEDPQLRDELLAGAVREVARSDRLLTSLLNLARFESDEPLSRTPSDLVALCRDEVERCGSLAPHLEVELTTGPAPAGPVDLDPNAVRELLSNLLDNALRHATRAVCVEVIDRGDDGAEVRVRDDGPGVPPDLADRIFERFASLDRRGGSGLGLAIGRAIAANHGGSLEYDDGAFVLRLPPSRISSA